MPRPVANTLTSVSGAEASEANARNRISAARGDQAAGAPDAVDDRRVGGAGAVVLLAHPGEDEDLVVHRQAEEEREDHQRDPRR